MPTKFRSLIQGRQRDEFPGDEAYILSAPATDRDGREWGAGTEYTPIDGGRNPDRNCDYQLVLINGFRVVFESDREARR